MDVKNRDHISWKRPRKRGVDMQRVIVTSISAVHLRESINNILLVVETRVKRVEYVSAYRRWRRFCSTNELVRGGSV